MKRLFMVFTMVAVVAATVSAGIARNAGTRGAEFLAIDIGARHVALGGTYAAYGNDVFSLHGQPAALADDPVSSDRLLDGVGFQHNEWVQGITQEYIGLQGSVGPGRWAVTGNVLGASNIERTTDDAFGRFGAVNGAFGVHDYAVGIHYGQRLGDRLAVGGAGRVIHSAIDNVSATGFGFDLGARYRVSEQWTAGASVTNIGSGLKFISTRSSLPITGRLGAAWHNRSWLATGDLILANGETLEGAAGVEWRPVEVLALRAGYKTQMNSDLGEGLTAGAGFVVSNFRVDYAYVPFGPLGNTHRISAQIAF